jgi:5-formyltetrahydrofolate cyclo-ligase
MALTKEQQNYWNSYLTSLPVDEHPSAPVITAGPCGDYAITDSLIQLYLGGQKTAGSGLVADFNYCHDPLPKIGDYWIVLNSKKEPALIVKTIKVEFNQFGTIPRHVVLAEGEGDLSTAYWKQGHEKIFAPHLKTWGVDELDKAEVITEHFKVVYNTP